jgi:hypothetical protein
MFEITLVSGNRGIEGNSLQELEGKSFTMGWSNPAKNKNSHAKSQRSKETQWPSPAGY